MPDTTPAAPDLRAFQGSQPAHGRDEDDQWALDRAADLLEGYAAYIRNDGAENLQYHPYLPEVDMVAANLRSFAAKPAPIQAPEGGPALAQRITDYLAGGGLFNPEQAHHDAVRDLLIECRAALAAQPEWRCPDTGRTCTTEDCGRECVQASAEGDAPRNVEFERGFNAGMHVAQESARLTAETAATIAEIEAHHTQPKGTELTDERIDEIYGSDECNPDDRGWGPKFSVMAFARAIEREALAPQAPSLHDAANSQDLIESVMRSAQTLALAVHFKRPKAEQDRARENLRATVQAALSSAQAPAPAPVALSPTASLKWDHDGQGGYYVEMRVNSLRSEDHAHAAMAYMERLFCGGEINVN